MPFSVFDRDRKDDALGERGGRIVGHTYKDMALSDDAFFPSQIRRCSFENVSFREYRANSPWFRESSFRNCDFSNSDLTDLTEWSNTFEDCLFERTNLDLSGIGYYGSRFRRCNFMRARFKKATFARPEFDECSFIDCVLDGADFDAGSFEHCRFKGRLKQVWFGNGFEFPRDARKKGKPRPNRMFEVDFLEAVLEDCMFTRAVPLDTVILPGSDHLLHDRLQERARNVFERSRSWPEPHKSEGESYFEMQRRYPEQQWDIINLRDMMEMFGDSAQLILDALGEPVRR